MDEFEVRVLEAGVPSIYWGLYTKVPSVPTYGDRRERGFLMRRKLTGCVMAFPKAPITASRSFKSTLPFERSANFSSISAFVGWLCLLFIHPRAPNLIGLRSAGTMPV